MQKGFPHRAGWHGRENAYFTIGLVLAILKVLSRIWDFQKSLCFLIWGLFSIRDFLRVGEKIHISPKSLQFKNQHNSSHQTHVGA